MFECALGLLNESKVLALFSLSHCNKNNAVNIKERYCKTLKYTVPGTRTYFLTRVYFTKFVYIQIIIIIILTSSIIILIYVIN